MGLRKQQTHQPEIEVEEIDFNSMKRMGTSKRESIRKSDGKMKTLDI